MSKYTASLAITKGAGGTGELELTATMREQGVSPSIAGKTARMACHPGSMQPKFLPAACRN